MVYHKHQFFAIIFRSYFPFSFFSFLLKFGNQFDRKVSLCFVAFPKMELIYQNTNKKKELTIKISSFIGGATRNRTGDRGVADLCLTAWPWRRSSRNGERFPIPYIIQKPRRSPLLLKRNGHEFSCP